MPVITGAANPRYGSADGSLIDLDVTAVGFDGPLPFTAAAHDSEAHGRDLHARASAGEFGPIAAYEPFVPPLDPRTAALVAAAEAPAEKVIG